MGAITGRTARLLILLVGVGALYYLMGLCGLVMGGGGIKDQTYLIWPPTGTALFAYLTWGGRVSPAIFITSVVLSLQDNTDLLASGLIAVGNTFTPWLATIALKRVGFDKRLYRLMDYLLFGSVGCTVVSTTNATIGIAALMLSGDVLGRDAALAWANWWVSDFLGSLMIGLTFLSLLPTPTRSVTASDEEGTS